MNLRPAHTDTSRVNGIVAAGGVRDASGRTRARKILQFRHYCTDAPI